MNESTPITRRTRLVRLGAAVLFAITPAVAVLAVPSVGLDRQQQAIIYLSAHPDDEFQMWSVAETAPDDVHIFAVLTRGEQTGFCEPDELEQSWQQELEPAPQPLPAGRWSAECAEARVSSMAGWFDDISDVSDFAPLMSGGPSRIELDSESARLCREDEAGTCLPADAVDVYLDPAGRGSVVVFDLGDGDLEPGEVIWAVERLLDDPRLGIAADMPVAGIVGNYSTSGAAAPLCFAYEHPDHRAIDDALWSHDFRVGFQAAATCALDPRRTLSLGVSDAATDRAFAVEPTDDGALRRTGAHTANYGWLHPEFYPVDRVGQAELFHQHQQFWVAHW
jgi:hypothetical protein